MHIYYFVTMTSDHVFTCGSVMATVIFSGGGKTREVDDRHILITLLLKGVSE